MVVVTLLECSKAYYRMHRYVLLHKFHKLGETCRLFDFLCAYFYKRDQCVQIDGEFSTTVYLEMGGPQESKVIMLAWFPYINDIV